MNQTLQNSGAVRAGFGALSLVLFAPHLFDMLKDFECNVLRPSARHV